MNLSDMSRIPAAAAQPGAETPLDPQALIAQLGGEVAGALSSALERVTALAATGRISRESLRALREEIDRARRAGIVGQQVVRLGSGQVTLMRERLDLTALLREALRLRGREIAARGIEVRLLCDPAEVRSDATLLFTLLQAALDWSFEHAVSRVDLTVTLQRQWPERASVHVAFAHRPPDQVDADSPTAAEAATPGLDSMSWRLVQQAARALDMALVRRDGPGTAELSFEFVETLAPRVAGLGTLGGDDAANSSMSTLNSQPLPGRQVLVVAARREVRNVVREALRKMGLVVQYVTSVEEARRLCAEGAPHVLVHEAAQGGEALERLRTDLSSAGMPLALIQIADEGRAFEVLNSGGQQVTRIGCNGVIESLPAAMHFELSRLG